MERYIYSSDMTTIDKLTKAGFKIINKISNSNEEICVFENNASLFCCNDIDKSKLCFSNKMTF